LYEADVSLEMLSLKKDFKKIWDKLWSTYKEEKFHWEISEGEYRFNPLAFPGRPYQERAFTYRMLRAIGDTGLGKDDFFQAVMRGFSYDNLCAFAYLRSRCESLAQYSSVWNGIHLESAEMAHYQDIYLIRLSNGWIYTGSGSVTVPFRVRSHKISIKALRAGKVWKARPQWVHICAAKYGREEFFKLCQYADEVPKIIVIVAEILLIVLFGCFHDTGPSPKQINVVGYNLAQRLRSDHSWQLPGEHMNRSLPTNEDIIKTREIIRVRCWSCGDSQELQLKYGYHVRVMVHVHSAKPTLCSRCSSDSRRGRLSANERMIDITPWLCTWYVRDEMGMPQAACFCCGDEDPETLSFNSATQKVCSPFVCQDCDHQRHIYINSFPWNTPLPEYLWPDHRRRKLQCQSCGPVEGTGNHDIGVRDSGRRKMP
jgi:hypothetical protein